MFILRTVVLIGAIHINLMFKCCSGKCEDRSSLPMITPLTDNQYLCMVTFQEPGHQSPELACNGEVNYHPEGSMKSGDATNEMYSFPSAIVKSGCSLSVFQEYNYLGERKEFSGPMILPLVPGTNPNPSNPGSYGFKSNYCSCDLTNLDCTPQDEFQVLMQCDATNSSVEALCRYSASIGTSFTSSVSKNESIGASIRGSLTATLGASASTGFSWAEISDDMKNDLITIDVSAAASPGTKLKIEQATGFCGGSVVKTTLFKFSYLNGTETLKSETVRLRDIKQEMQYHHY